MAASKRAVDFTNVKDSSGINPKHVEDGDYLAEVVEVRDQESKGDKTPMWLFILRLDEMRSATYPYYCKLEENQLWKVRNLLIAAGKTVPKKRVNVDPNNLVGAKVGITLSSDEYEGKMKSVIDAIFPASELEPEEPEPPARKSSTKSKKAAEVEEDVEDDDTGDDDLDEMDLEDL